MWERCRALRDSNLPCHVSSWHLASGAEPHWKVMSAAAPTKVSQSLIIPKFWPCLLQFHTCSIKYRTPFYLSLAPPPACLYLHTELLCIFVTPMAGDAEDSTWRNQGAVIYSSFILGTDSPLEFYSFGSSWIKPTHSRTIWVAVLHLEHPTENTPISTQIQLPQKSTLKEWTNITALQIS